MIITEEKHYYPVNGTIIRISSEAAEERRDNWHEIPGWADGWAIVKHPDWQAIYDYLCANYWPDWRSKEHLRNGWGPTWCIYAQDPAGLCAHIGSISLRNGQLELNG